MHRKCQHFLPRPFDETAFDLFARHLYCKYELADQLVYLRRERYALIYRLYVCFTASLSKFYESVWSGLEHLRGNGGEEMFTAKTISTHLSVLFTVVVEKKKKKNCILRVWKMQIEWGPAISPNINSSALAVNRSAIAFDTRARISPVNFGAGELFSFRLCGI